MTGPTATGMHAVEIESPGPSGRLQLCRRPIPTIGADEVLIEVAAAGLNRADIGQRLGRYPPPPGASDLPGLEVSGVVVEVGSQAARWKEGDRVCALLPGGGYAEYVSAPAALCLPIPEGLGFAEAAALPEACFTVWSNVFMRGGLADGESLLVQGGASGIGTLAIQLATALGHRVFATAGSDEKCEACRSLGAVLAVNYRKGDFAAMVREGNSGRGIDVILDMVAGDYIDRELKLLADGGRLVLIAYQGGTRVTADFSEIRRRLWITGSTLRGLPSADKALIAEAVEARVWPLLAAGKIRAVIDSTYPLEAAEQAHARMMKGEHTGKIVLSMPSQGRSTSVDRRPA
ncbi:NAD(P)H-quinone oxidoreductase [Burkholderiales bacterium 8X]|nr:NAD(P)H-quinone oxidoreductase [Burkholderiales bacterium 8X]